MLVLLFALAFRHASGEHFETTWDPAFLKNNTPCSVDSIRNGAEYFATLYRLFGEAKEGSEVMFMTWDINLEVHLLGYGKESVLANGKNATLLYSMLEAANRGAKIHVQFWVTRGTKSFMPSTSGVEMANRLRTLNHENITVFVDYGRRGVATPGTWVDLMRAVVFDRKLALVSSFDMTPTTFSAASNPYDDRHVTVGAEIRFDDWSYDLTVRQKSDRNFGLKIRGPAAESIVKFAFHRENTFCGNLYGYRRAHYPSCEHDNRLPLLIVQPAHYVSPYDIEDGLFLPDYECHVAINGLFKLLGVKSATKQIAEDYEEIIDSAKNYLYIENQYFISQKNQLVNKLFARIERAINDCSNFSVVIVLPMEAKEKSAHKKNRKTLQTGLISRIEKALGASRCEKLVTDFISVQWIGSPHRLQNGDNVIFSVYTHAKFMIADDSKLTIGSANWNDRSFLGYDGDLNLYVKGNLKNLRRQAFVGLGMRSHEIDRVCSGKNVNGEDQSLASIFYNAGRINNHSVKRLMNLDFEQGVDARKGEPITVDMQFGSGNKWQQRKEQNPHVKDRMGESSIFNTMDLLMETE